MTTWRTVKPSGRFPAGMTVKVITLSLAGGLGPDNRDGGTGGDGQWYLVRYPNGILAGQVRTLEELTGMGISPGNLEEIPASHDTGTTVGTSDTAEGEDTAGTVHESARDMFAYLDRREP
jgi:hypothetical protein